MIITSKDNDIIKQVSKLMSSASYRREKESFVAEGARLCMDGVLSGAEVKAFLYTQNGMEKYSNEFEKIISVSKKHYEISEQLFKKISDTNSPQGLLCVFKTLDKKTLSYKIEIGRHYAGLENIQDPSNMGTILRTAEALGIDG
ncbi:MAG: RNA methyltransferase, partial [Clostridia bacterium]|nr:RNA methyltransferase [Clostridia bacterium]